MKDDLKETAIDKGEVTGKVAAIALFVLAGIMMLLGLAFLVLIATDKVIWHKNVDKYCERGEHCMEMQGPPMPPCPTYPPEPTTTIVHIEQTGTANNFFPNNIDPEDCLPICAAIERIKEK